MNTGNLTPNTALSVMQAAQLSKPQASADQKRLEDSAREFEAVFISEMVKPMFEGLETNELFGGGKGEEIFRGIMIQEYGKKIAEKDVIGIQTQVKNKLIEMQAQRTAENATPAIQSGKVIDLEPIER